MKSMGVSSDGIRFQGQVSSDTAASGQAASANEGGFDIS